MFEMQIESGATLRLLEERHGEELHRLVERNRDRLRVWVPWLRSTATADLTRELIRRNLQRLAAANGFSAGLWIGGELRGQIALEYVDRDNSTTEIGYWIDAGVEGKGIVSGACRRLVDHAFGELGLNRVQIRCAAENVRSRAVAERLGFVQEGVLRQLERLEDRWVDLVIYGMLRDEWQAKRPARDP